MFNKTRIAIIICLGGGIACLILVNKSTNKLDFELAGYVAGGILGVVASLFLLWEVSAPNANLGVLQEEMNLLIGALLFVFFTGAAQIAKPFRDLPNTPDDNQSTEWILGRWTWGEKDENCSPQVTITRSVNGKDLVFAVPSGTHTRRIVGSPTADAIETDQGIYTRQPDGDMTSTERGNEDKRFVRCRP